jgi:DNA adenine methylase
MVIGDTPFIRDLYEDYIEYEYEKKYRFRLHSNRIT